MWGCGEVGRPGVLVCSSSRWCLQVVGGVYKS